MYRRKHCAHKNRQWNDLYRNHFEKGEFYHEQHHQGRPATELKELISYEEGSIANLDIAHADNMKFVLMAFDEGTGLTPHRAPGNAILTALEASHYWL